MTDQISGRSFFVQIRPGTELRDPDRLAINIAQMFQYIDVFLGRDVIRRRRNVMQTRVSPTSRPMIDARGESPEGGSQTCGPELQSIQPNCQPPETRLKNTLIAWGGKRQPISSLRIAPSWSWR